jgi:hypothetical protein
LGNLGNEINKQKKGGVLIKKGVWNAIEKPNIAKPNKRLFLLFNICLFSWNSLNGSKYEKNGGSCGNWYLREEFIGEQW